MFSKGREHVVCCARITNTRFLYSRDEHLRLHQKVYTLDMAKCFQISPRVVIRGQWPLVSFEEAKVGFRKVYKKGQSEYASRSSKEFVYVHPHLVATCTSKFNGVASVVPRLFLAFTCFVESVTSYIRPFKSLLLLST